MMSEEDQRAAGDTDLQKEGEGDPLSVGNIDDDDDDGGGDGRGGGVDDKVEATDEGDNETSSNGKRAAYPNDGCEEGADGTAKKRKINSSPGDSETTITEKNDRPSGLNEALLVEVASFVPRGLTLGNVCVALGLEKAKLLRKNYLKKNYFFLEEAMRGYCAATWRTWGKQKAAVDVGAWMAVNTDWKEVYKFCSSLLPGKAIPARDTVAFLMIFNPQMAIDLSLLEVLQFFVEEVDISVCANSIIRLLGPEIRFLGPDAEEQIRRLFVDTTSSLLQLSFWRDNFDAFEYLLSRVDISSVSYLLLCLVYDQQDYQRNDQTFVIDSTKYFEAIVEHPEFSPNAEILVDGTICSPLSLIISSYCGDFVRGCFRGGLLKKLEILLEAGADPNLSSLFHANGFGVHATPLELARTLRNHPRFSMWRSQWQAVLDVLTDHSLVRSMAELSLHS